MSGLVQRRGSMDLADLYIKKSESAQRPISLCCRYHSDHHLFSPHGGTSKSEKPNESNSLLRRASSVAGSSFGPRGSVLGCLLWVFRLWWGRSRYTSTTTPQQHSIHNNTYTNSVLKDQPDPSYSTTCTLQSFLSIPPTLQFELSHGYSGT